MATTGSLQHGCAIRRIERSGQSQVLNEVVITDLNATVQTYRFVRGTLLFHLCVAVSFRSLSRGRQRPTAVHRSIAPTRGGIWGSTCPLILVLSAGPSARVRRAMHL